MTLWTRISYVRSNGKHGSRRIPTSKVDLHIARINALGHRVTDVQGTCAPSDDVQVTRG